MIHIIHYNQDGFATGSDKICKDNECTLGSGMATLIAIIGIVIILFISGLIFPGFGQTIHIIRVLLDI